MIIERLVYICLMSVYNQRGVSAQKEEVHNAIKNLDAGLYKNAFCKLYEDKLGGNSDYINLMHADGAGTKSVLAYLYWKETGDVSVWKGIAEDAVAMNLDDLLCVGIYDNICFSSTIDRNKMLITGEVIETIITATQSYFNRLQPYGIRIHYMGGETADVGDVVRTIAVNGTMAARWPKNKLVTNNNIKAGNVILGLASFGKAVYEDAFNSGIGSNGLTSARHDVLFEKYRNFPETYSPEIDQSVVYLGKNSITDTVKMDNETHTIQSLVLSPTRTFAPLMKVLLEKYFNDIDGLIHCSGGGQTKCLKYIDRPLKIIKDNLFNPPPVFKLIQQNSGADDREMYQVFNMGHRMEIYTNEAAAHRMIEEAAAFNIEARIVGRVEGASKKELVIERSGNTIVF